VIFSEEAFPCGVIINEEAFASRRLGAATR